MSALTGNILAQLTQAGNRSPVDAKAASASARRTILLIGAIILMGLGDLFCTLTYMKLIGLPEANPIARWMAAMGSTQGLVLYKLLTIAMSCGALFLGRFHKQSELCAWFCTLVLFALSIHWINFNRSIVEHTSWITLIAADEKRQVVAHAGPGKSQESWVTLTD